MEKKGQVLPSVEIFERLFRNSPLKTIIIILSLIITQQNSGVANAKSLKDLCTSLVSRFEKSAIDAYPGEHVIRISEKLLTKYPALREFSQIFDLVISSGTPITDEEIDKFLSDLQKSIVNSTEFKAFAQYLQSKSVTNNQSHRRLFVVMQIYPMGEDFPYSALFVPMSDCAKGVPNVLAGWVLTGAPFNAKGKYDKFYFESFIRTFIHEHMHGYQSSHGENFNNIFSFENEMMAVVFEYFVNKIEQEGLDEELFNAAELLSEFQQEAGDVLSKKVLDLFNGYLAGKILAAYLLRTYPDLTLSELIKLAMILDTPLDSNTKGISSQRWDEIFSRLNDFQSEKKVPPGLRIASIQDLLMWFYKTYLPKDLKTQVYSKKNSFTIIVQNNPNMYASARDMVHAILKPENDTRIMADQDITVINLHTGEKTILKKGDFFVLYREGAYLVSNNANSGTSKLTIFGQSVFGDVPSLTRT